MIRNRFNLIYIAEEFFFNEPLQTDLVAFSLSKINTKTSWFCWRTFLKRGSGNEHLRNCHCHCKMWWVKTRQFSCWWKRKKELMNVASLDSTSDHAEWIGLDWWLPGNQISRFDGNRDLNIGCLRRPSDCASCSNFFLKPEFRYPDIQPIQEVSKENKSKSWK